MIWTIKHSKTSATYLMSKDDSSWILQNDQLTLGCFNQLSPLNELPDSEDYEPPGDIRNECQDNKPVIQQSENPDCELESDLPRWA